jgi:hypothetical protein
MSECKVPHYEQPSELGLPIIKLLIDNPEGECRLVIYVQERRYGWGFNLNNAVRYLWRLGEKGDAVRDLNKAIDYLAWELECPISTSQEHLASVQTAIGACKSLRRRLLVEVSNT